MAIKLQIEHLTKRYRLERESSQAMALHDVSLAVNDGEFLALVGPSGCGKTSLINIVAGLLPYDEGVVTIDGTRVHGPGTDRAVVFQHPSLLPWRTIAGNVRYGMEMQKRFDESTMQQRAGHFLKLVGLSGFEKHFPGELSGGMQQRVAIAQALMMQPKVLLMDEPFGALDHNTRLEMQMLILEQWKDDRMTIVFVTHDLEEACYISTRVIGLSQYWSDDAGQPGTGAVIVTDLRTPGGHPKPTAIRATAEFHALLEQVRHDALDPENRQRLHHFNLTHQDALEPEPLAAAEVSEAEEEQNA